MDDFEDEDMLYYDDEDDIEQEESESLKEKYDKAQEYKEKFDKLKDKYSNKSANNAAGDAGKQAGKDAAKQSGKEAGKQASKEGAKQAGKETAKQAGKEGAKQAGKEAGKQAGKEVAKQAGKQAAKEGAKVAAEGAAASTGVGIIVAAGIEAADKLKKVQDKLDKKIKEETGVDAKQVRRWSIPAILVAVMVLILLIPAMVASAMFSVSETASSELTTLVRAREENNEKDLILFTKSEIKDLLKKDVEIDEQIAEKLAEEGYTIEKNDAGKYWSICYKNILEGYGSDLKNIFMPTDLTNASNGVEDVLDDGQSYDSLDEEAQEVAVSLKNVRKYLLAEIENFNKINWQKAKLNVDYAISGARRSTTYSGNNAYNQYLNDPNKISGLSGTVSSETAAANYTVKDKDGQDTMLKTPDFSDMGVQGDKNERALSYVKTLSPYMQKWIIPYAIYIDTQDEEFVNGIMSNIYHPVDVKFFQLKKLVKEVTFEYYMECYTYTATRYVYKKEGILGERIVDSLTTEFEIVGSIQFGKNTRDETLGEHLQRETFVEEITSGDTTYKKYKQTYKIVKLNDTHEIAKDSSGNPLVAKVKINRKLENAETVPEITYIGGFYEIMEKEFTIVAIDETQTPNESQTGALSVNETTGRGTQVLNESWNETISLVESKTTPYELSYLTEEELENLGRKVSIIEWYQDSKGMVSGQDGEYGAGGVNQTQQQYVDRFKADALNDMNESGVLASITLAQGILEGGSGTSTLASVHNNHFGIKAGSSWTGATVTMRTAEYDGSGNRYTINAVFRSYSSAADSFADHSRFLWNTKGHATKEGGYRYRDCTNYAKEMNYTAPDGLPTYNYRAAIQAIVDGGYCTDPSYVSKICSIIETYKLYEIDRQSTWDGNPPDYATAGSGSGGSGSSGSSTGMGEVQYSYEDMEFAFYQIEKWYEQYGYTSSIFNLADRVILPEGGFAWPVKISSSNPGAANIYRFYDVNLSQGGLHRGLDISTGNVSYYDSDKELNIGEIVVATHDGTVIKVEPVTDESKCAYIEIRTENGEFRTKYSYLSEIYVQEGDLVTKNQEIGRIGNTGAHNGDSGLYLHYEMYYKGQNMDPLTYYNIAQNGTKVDNYDELDLNTITNPQEYQYESSKTYIGGNSSVVEFAAQYLGYNLRTLQDLRGNYLNDHWCAWFASWCLRECGIDVIECSNTNYCPTIWNETTGTKHPYGDGYVPVPGDIVMFQKSTTARYSHIAIVSKVENGVVYWIGGNQGGNCPFGSSVTESNSTRDSRLLSYIVY